MIQSMTGYGKAEAQLNSGKLTVEIRTLNAKSADINIKTQLLPKDKDIPVRKKLAERLQQRGCDPRVARPTMPHMKHFRQQEQRPHVVVRSLLDRARADPAIGALVRENGVDVTLCAGFHIIVVQQPGQIDETVQPIWHALPAFRLAADPSGILHIRPEFIKVTGLSIRLQLQLTTQPSLRRQCAAIDKPAKCFSQFHVHSFFQ